jgi:YVTN family beta-propeller protein
MHRRLVVMIAAALISLLLPDAPRAQPAAAAPKVYVGLFKDNAVAVVDPAAGRVVATIPVPAGPHGLVVTPDGRKVYVSSDGASTVSVIDTATDRVVGSVEVGPNPHGLAVSRDGRRVLVSAFGAGQAMVIDTATDTVTARMPVAAAHNGAFSPDGRLAFVASQQQGATALVVFDLASGTEAGRVPLDRTPRALDVSPDGKWLSLTVAGSDAVRVLDPATRQVLGQVAVGASPHFALFTPDSGAGLAVSQGPGELAVLDPGARSVKAVVAVGKTPHWVAVSSDGRTAYVANEGSNDVSIVDLAGGKVTATIPVGAAPRKIAVQPGAGAKAAAVGAASRVAYSDHGTIDGRGRRKIEIEADDYYFKPTFVRGTPGQSLVLEVENESGTLHNISIPAQGIDRDIAPKGKVEVTVVFPASGVVEFHCKLHAALGMNGGLLAGSAQITPSSRQRARSSSE